MTASSSARRLITIAAWLVAFHVLLAYGLPEGVFIAAILVLALVYWRTGAIGAVFTSVTLLLVTLVYGLALKVTGLEDRIYYRPDEKYVRFDYTHNHRLYAPNVHIDSRMPHGDLRAMSTAEIAEPRPMVFHTDSDGFRNERDYHGQRYLLVGDSFIAGNSNSQPDMLYAQLLADHGIDAYNLAYPGNLADYAAYIRGFRERHGEDFRVLLFLFEGNDFDESRGRNPGWLARNGKRYYRMFSDFNTYRVTMSLWKRFARTRAIREGTGIDIAALAGKPAALYQQYGAATRRPQLVEVEGFESTLLGIHPYIEHVYFIPTNYRVYHRHLAPGETLPNAQWDYLQGLCRKHALRCTNLTEPLVRESDRLLKQGKLTWWRDDTHWNRAGISVAARVVAADLKAADVAGR